ncbi:MAG: hypothetical protein WD942_04160, partial [Dehalococcoidia bacterium]
MAAKRPPLSYLDRTIDDFRVLTQLRGWHVAKILIADKIAQQGVDLLSSEHDVEVSTGLSEDDLCAAVADVAALIVRSQTQVTAKVLAAATKLQIVA